MLVSVVIPSYNHKKYIIKAIESVLDQDWPEIDLVVIDDGSTDGSVEIISDLISQRGGFRFFSRENRGVIATLNEGISIANGELICFCSSDDFLPPGSLRSRAVYLIENPYSVAVFADIAQVDIRGNHIRTAMDESAKAVFSAPDPIPLFLDGVRLPLHSIMSRRNVFLDIGGFDPRFKVCEDLDVQLLHFLKGKVGYIDQVVFCYRLHGENISYKIKHLTSRDKVLLYSKYLNEVERLVPYRKIIRKHLVRYYVKYGKNLLQKFPWSLEDRSIMRSGWKYSFSNPRLLFYLVVNELKMRFAS